MAPPTAPAVEQFFQVMLKAMGITAEPITTPMKRYTQPSERPIFMSTIARMPLSTAYTHTMMRDTNTICLPVALGLMYVLWQQRSMAQAELSTPHELQAASALPLSCTSLASHSPARPSHLYTSYVMSDATASCSELAVAVTAIHSCSISRKPPPATWPGTGTAQPSGVRRWPLES